jgi:hypothetical protein
MKLPTTIVGTGGVGKSTVFKQLKLLHTGGFTDDDRIEARGAIVKQIVTILIQVMQYGLQNSVFVS